MRPEKCWNCSGTRLGCAPARPSPHLRLKGYARLCARPSSMGAGSTFSRSMIDRSTAMQEQGAVSGAVCSRRQRERGARMANKGTKKRGVGGGGGVGSLSVEWKPVFLCRFGAFTAL